MARKRFVLFLLVISYHFVSGDFFPENPGENVFPERHERLKRFIRVFSRKPDPDSEYESGIGFQGHLKNFLKGGKVNFEMKVPDKVWKFPFFKELDDRPPSKDGPLIKGFIPLPKEIDSEDPKKDFGLLEREGDYGSFIDPRVRRDP